MTTQLCSLANYIYARKTSEMANASTPTSPESVEYLTVSLVTEQKEKGKKELNVIVHKLDESTTNDGPARNSDDVKRCESLFQTYLGVTAPITNAFRLWKKSDKLSICLR